MQLKAKYIILENNIDRILIRDLDVGMSITNDAEAVVEDLIKQNLITTNKVVLYQDTEGNVDKLLHNGRKFIGFGFGEKI